MSSRPKFSPREQRVLDILHANKLVDVVLLFHVLYPDADSVPEGKRAHQYVGTVISRINMKLGERRIVPGNIKRTYTIHKTDAAAS